MGDLLKLVHTQFPGLVIFVVIAVILVVTRTAPVVQVHRLTISDEDNVVLTFILSGIHQQTEGFLEGLSEKYRNIWSNHKITKFFKAQC